MDHVVVPLDSSHTRTVTDLAREVATEAGVPAAATTAAHITLVSYADIPPDRAVAALRPVARATAPFVVRAHGYGIFTGDAPCDLSLHVMVVRTAALDTLQTRALEALRRAGATLSGVTDPLVWSPHITLLDRALTPACLGAVVERLAQRPHRSWSIDVREVLVTSRDLPPGPAPAPLRLAGTG